MHLMSVKCVSSMVYLRKGHLCAVHRSFCICGQLYLPEVHLQSYVGRQGMKELRWEGAC
jgi:hypothetical protein